MIAAAATMTGMWKLSDVVNIFSVQGHRTRGATKTEMNGHREENEVITAGREVEKYHPGAISN